MTKQNKRQTQKSIENAMEQVAIITYNSVGRQQKYENGWMSYPGKKVLILQNGHRSERLVPDSADSNTAAQIRKGTIHYLLEGIKPILQQLNHIYLYVGSHGAEEAISMTQEIPAEKITYVMCNCNSYAKNALIDRLGNNKAKIMNCECGGNHTLENILEELKNGDKK